MSSSTQSLNYGSRPKKVPHTFSQHPAVGYPSDPQGLEAFRRALFEREPVEDGNRHVALPHGTSDAAASERVHRERMENKFMEIEKRSA